MKDLLVEEIKQEFDELPHLGIGTPEYEKTVAGLTKLMSTQIELDKFEAEQQCKLTEQKKQEELESLKMELDKQERENRAYLEKKKLELDEQKLVLDAKQQKHTKWNTVLQTLGTVGLGVAGLVVTVWSYNKAWNKEDDGYMISTEPGKDSQKKAFGKR